MEHTVAPIGDEACTWHSPKLRVITTDQAVSQSAHAGHSEIASR